MLILRLTTCLTLAVLSTGCASIWPPKPKAEDVAATQEVRHEDIVKSFEQKRDSAQYQAALVRWREGDIKATDELLSKLLARRPDHRDARLLQAELRLVEEQPQAALEDIEKLVAENDKDAEAHHVLALLLEACERTDEALVHFDRAASLSPENRVFAASYQTALTGEIDSPESSTTAVASDAGYPQSNSSVRHLDMRRGMRAQAPLDANRR